MISFIIFLNAQTYTNFFSYATVFLTLIRIYMLPTPVINRDTGSCDGSVMDARSK
jgi:hypothetical protein